MTNITLKMVAAEAGVSLATASAAMRGLDIVKPTTREKVETAAEKLNYQKNSAASVLSSHRNRSKQKQAFMVWLSAYHPDEQVGIDWDSGPRYAIAEAKRLGLMFASYNIDHPDDASRIMREIEARGCDGIVFGSNSFSDLPTIAWNRFSVISTDEGRLKEGFDIVLANQFRATLGLLRRVKEAGYKRIGICLREHAYLHPDDEVRYGAAAAFQLYDREKGAEKNIPIIRMQHDIPDAADRLASWVKKYKPDVVLGFGSEEMRILKKKGFKIPEDFAYVGLHVSEPEQGTYAGRKHNKEVVPAYAVRVLMEKMRHGMRGLSPHPQETEIIPPILEGSSCPGLVGDSRS